MTSSFQIEPLAGEDDLRGVMEVDSESFARPWTRQMYEGELANPGLSIVLVIRTQECPVAGYCSYRVVLDEVHINNVAVRPAYRGAGLGRGVVLDVIRDARGRGCQRMLLEVRSANTAARKLYESLGFVEIGRRRGYYRQPTDDALILALDLRNLE